MRWKAEVALLMTMLSLYVWKCLEIPCGAERGAVCLEMSGNVWKSAPSPGLGKMLRKIFPTGQNLSPSVSESILDSSRRSTDQKLFKKILKYFSDTKYV